MFLSIVICAYNSEKYLKRCLDSIINQDFLDYEIIVVNDGSTDKTKEIAGKYKLTLINKNNTGLADSRNVGLSRAQGDYIWFVDSDDELELDAFNIIYKKINESNADILRFNYRRITNGKMTSYPSFQSNVYEDRDLESFRHTVIKNSYNRLFTCWMHVYRKKLIEDIKFVNEKEYAFDDTVFNSLVYQKANKIQIINNILYRYIDNDSSITRKNKSWTKQLLNAYFYLKDEYKKLNIYNSYKDDLISAFLDFAILGNGEAVGGCFIMEYLSRENSHEFVNEIINSDMMQELMNDSKGHVVNRKLMYLYQSIFEKDENKLFSTLYYLRKNNNKEKTSDRIKLKCRFEYVNMNDDYIAVAIDGGYSGTLTLNKEAYIILKEIEKREDLNQIKNNLYTIFNDSEKEEVDTNLSDLITILKSENIID